MKNKLLTRVSISTEQARNTKTSTSKQGYPGVKLRWRQRLDLGPAAVAHLRNELRLNWSQIARSLGISARTVQRIYRQNSGEELDSRLGRRGRPCVDVDPAEVVGLRDSGMSWRAIAKNL